jgi:hypothetical protein
MYVVCYVCYVGEDYEELDEYGDEDRDEDEDLIEFDRFAPHDHRYVSMLIEMCVFMHACMYVCVCVCVCVVICYVHVLCYKCGFIGKYI